jgi:hypothetical protein
MPSLESSQVARHILPERLFKVAARGETFQDEELQHLKDCVLCQERFTQFMQQRLKDREIDPPRPPQL